MADRTQDRIGAPGSLEELQQRLAGAFVPSSVEELQRQFADALEQQAATAQILEAIGRAPGDVQPVLQAVVDQAGRLCAAEHVHLFLRELSSGQYALAASYGATDETHAFWKKFWGTRPPAPGDGTMAGRAISEKRPQISADVLADPSYGMADAAREQQVRSVIAVPLVRGDEALGVLALWSSHVNAFSERQVQLVSTFASQALIAVENARLFDETKEGLERQQAVSDILAAISQSPGDLDPVLDTVMRRALILCEAEDVIAIAVEGDYLRRIGHIGPVPAGDAGRAMRIMDAPPAAARAILERRAVHIEDLHEYPEDEYAIGRKMASEIGIRTALAVPLLRKGTVIGAIVLRRQEVRPFSTAHIALLETFADQAAIAMENVRLFNETKEALERQTAISDILRVISSSPNELRPTFEAVASSARRFCQAEDASVIIRLENDVLHVAAHDGHLGRQEDYSNVDWPMDRTSVTGRAMIDQRPVHVDDLLAEAEEYPLGRSASLQHHKHRTTLAVPLLREGHSIGALLLRREEVRPFAQRQIELLETFADQAVIAIENVRLFNETKDALERQTAIAEVLRAISHSPTDFQPVLDAIAENAARFCVAEDATVMLLREGAIHPTAHFGTLPTILDRPGAPLSKSLPLDVSSVSGQAIIERRVIQIDDVWVAAESHPITAERGRELGYRSVVSAPLLREGQSIGTILLRRGDVRPFTPRQIDLLRTFADQAVIAIENVRLFNETKEALERQTAISDILRVISSSPSDVQPIFDAVASSARRFCGAEDASVIVRLQDEVLHVAAHDGFDLMEDYSAVDWPMDRESVTGRAMIDQKLVYVEDLLAEEVEYPKGRSHAMRYPHRTTLAVPLVREDRSVGAILLRRKEVRPFTPRQIELVRTFADQAAIAIENVRLFNETREALEQQTAVGEILGAISTSPTDVRPVLDTVARNAATLLEAHDVLIVTAHGDRVEVSAHVGDVPVLPGAAGQMTRGMVSHRAILEARPVHVPDMLEAEAEYPEAFALAKIYGGRTSLAVPLLRQGVAIGSILLRRTEMRPFTDQQIRLLHTFADQAAIAIENVRLFNETKEALERQTAIAEILKVISGSPTDLQPVLDAIANSARQFCGAEDAFVGIADGNVVSVRAHVGPLGVPQGLFALDRRTVTTRSMVERTTIQVADLQRPEYALEYPVGHEQAKLTGQRATLATPLLREGRAIGAIMLRRSEPRPFTERQVELAQTFADQAVIAIENVRLFNDTNEALAQQTATADVLKVISRSAFDLDAVFENLLRNAVTICNADWGSIQRAEGDGVRNVAQVGGSAAFREVNERTVYRPGRDTANGRALLEKRPIHIHDLAADPEYKFTAAVELGGIRTNLVVPMLRDDKVVGTFGLSRNEVRPFSDKEIALVSTFADQAAIAIENVRLFNETKEALEQQAATARVLQVISRSAFDLRSALETLVEEAARLCAADQGSIHRWDGTAYRTAAFWGPHLSEEYKREGFESPRYPGRDTLVGRTALERQVVHVADATTDPEYKVQSLQKLGGYRTMLGVPLIRDGFPIGVFALMRNEVSPFSDRQIELVRTFADQAAIAMENVRLFNETKEALERQTAVAGILRAISESPSDVQPVLDTIAESVARFCSAEDAAVVLVEDNKLRTRAHHGPIRLRTQLAMEFPLSRGTVTGRSIIDRKSVQVADLLAEPDAEYPIGKEQARLMGHRTTLATPLMREGVAIGAILLRRMEVRPFTDHQLELVRTFADQAVIALENVRLFNETKEALEQQTATSEVLKVISRSAFDLQPVLDAVIQTAGRLARADASWMRRVDRNGYLRGAPGTGAHWGASPELVERYRQALASLPTGQPQPETLMGRAWSERRTIHVEDLDARADLQGSRLAVGMGARTVLAVPMLRQGEPLGFMVIARTRVEPFSEREIQLVETFADQAVIAIENVRLFREIQDQSRQLEVASRHKSEFLANMSHELRTPLNAIIGFTDVMLEEMFGTLNDKQKEYLEDVRNSGTHLLTLINDILDLSKIEAGRVELEMGEFSFPDALENALTLVRERATRHGISLAADVAGDVGRITADERKVKQVLVNLLANAVKFTPDGGRVTVKARRVNGEVEVAVHDTGIGVATEDQERIFDEFQQVGRDPERSREGTGLGLTLAKRFVELHGGRIWVESEVGKGSTFTFAIPVRQTALAGAKG